MRAGLVLVAGGKSLRFADSVKKQFVELEGEPIFIRTLRKFAQFDEIVERILVLPEDDIDDIKAKFSSQLAELKVNKFGTGGKERVYSVINGFQAIRADVDFAIIHDAVRPFVSADIIVNALRKAEQTGAAIVALEVRDTLKRVSKNSDIVETVDRRGIYAAQTPQIFECSLFEKAIENWRKLDEPAVTDDAMLVEMLGEKVSIVEGSFLNIKITTPEDRLLAQAILNFLPPEKQNET